MTRSELVTKLQTIADRGYGSLTTSAQITVDKPIVIEAPDYWGLRWLHNGPPVRYTGTGPWLATSNLKDSLIDGVKVTVPGPTPGSWVPGGVWEFWAKDRLRLNGSPLTGSTSGVEMARCDSGGLRILAPNGEDACNFHIRDTDFVGGGVVVDGPNNLEHLFVNVNSSGAAVAYKFDKGGAGTTFVKCGGSDNGELFRLLAGFHWPDFSGGRGERNKKTFCFVGGGTSGFGLRIDGREDVDGDVWLDAVTGGQIAARNTRVSGACRVLLDNPTDLQAVLDLRTCRFVDATGKVIGAQVVQKGKWTLEGQAVAA